MNYELIIDVAGRGIRQTENELNSLTVGMERTSRASDKLENSFRNVSNSERRLNNSNVNRFTGSIRQANAEVSSLSRSMNTLSGLIISGAFIGLAKNCLSAAQEVAGLKAQLRAVGEDADQAYNSLRDFGNTLSGISTEGVVSAYTAFIRMNYTTEQAKSNIEALSKGLASFGASSGMSNVMTQLEQLGNKTSGFTQDLNAISNYLRDVKKVVTESFNVSSIEDLYSRGITGRDVVNAITSHYSSLEAPVDDINMTMNRLNSSIQDIKANVGIALEPMVTSLSKIVQLGAKASQSNWFSALISSATKFVGIVGGIALLNKVFGSLNNTLQQTRLYFERLFQQSNHVATIVQRLRLSNSGVNLNMSAPQNYARNLVSSANFVRRNPENLGSLRQELTIYNQIRSNIATINQLERDRTELVRNRAIVHQADEAKEQEQTGLLQRRAAIDAEINQLENTQIVNGRQGVEINSRIYSLQRQRANISARLNTLGAERVELSRAEASARSQIAMYDNVIGTRRTLTTARAIQGQNVRASLGNLGAQVSPYISMGVMMLADFLRKPLDEFITNLKDALKSLNFKELAKQYRDAEQGLGRKYWEQSAGSGAMQGASIGAMGFLGGPLVGVLTTALGALIGEIWGGESARNTANNLDAMGSISDQIERRYSAVEEYQRQRRINGEDTSLQDAYTEYRKASDAYSAYIHSSAFNINNAEDVKLAKQLQEARNEAEERFLTLQNQEIKNQQKINEETAKKNADINANIRAIQQRLAGDDYGAQMTQIQRNYERVLQDSQSTTLEQEQAYWVMQEQTAELNKQTAEKQKQEYINRLREESEIAYNNALLSGNRLLAERTRAQGEYNINALEGMNPVLNAQKQAIANNKAEIEDMQRKNKLLSTMDRYYGRSELAEKRDLRTKRDSVLNDITADQTDKDNAFWEEKLGLLDRSINKIKQYYSIYSQGLQEVMSKNKAVIDGAIQNAKSYRDAILGVVAEGQQALMSSGYFDTSRPQYSDEELREGARKYNADETYRKDLEERTDKLLFGGTTTYADKVIKSLENMEKYININETSGLQLLEVLKSMAPYIQGSSQLFEKAYNDQMAL